MLSEGDYPFLRGKPKLFLSVLFSPVEWHKTVLSVSFFTFKADVATKFCEVVERGFVRSAVYRIRENIPDSSHAEFAALAGLYVVLDTPCCDLCEGLKFKELSVNRAYSAHLIVNYGQFVSGAAFALSVCNSGLFSDKSQGSYSTQPAAGPCQKHQIITHTFSDGFTFKLSENCGNIHHSPAHWRGGVELFLYAYKRGIHAVQFFDERCEISDISADTVKPIDHDIVERLFPCALHHHPELRTVKIFRRESLVLVHQKIAVLCIRDIPLNVLPAEYYLVFDTLALAGEFRFSGIYCDLHERLLSLVLLTIIVCENNIVKILWRVSDRKIIMLYRKVPGNHQQKSLIAIQV